MADSDCEVAIIGGGPAGCAFDPDGGVTCAENCTTSVAGVYVAGDASRDVQLIIIAAAEGARAALAINKALVEEGA
jgi:thioredoxin reductase